MVCGTLQAIGYLGGLLKTIIIASLPRSGHGDRYLRRSGLYWYQSRLKSYLGILVYTPLIIPDILMGVSMLVFFVAVGLPLGLFTIFLAHVTFCVSYVTVTVMTRLEDFDYSVVEAARDLGARSRQVFTKVVAPIIMPGIMAGFLLSLTLSIDDFVITFFVAGPVRPHCR
jgi:spermidine/putrescine transport system permease protein